MRPLLVVVADFSTARFYRLPADSRRLRLLEVLHNPAARSHEHELVTSPPGRVYSRAVGRPQAFEARRGVKRLASERFAGAVAKRIGGRCAALSHEDVVVVAGGRLLGLVDRKLPRAAQHRLVAAVPRDLSHLAEPALSREILPLRSRAGAPH
ncbi:MAG TPA: host attachment protein [Steroidobacteraceae bacterium]|nr:host attachment protein [Steroidobacteraceae bacterium]